MIVPLLALCLVFVPSITYGNIIISEILFDAEGTDQDAEWIEVYNDGTRAEDLTRFTLLESGTRHALRGTGLLAPGQYAIIAAHADEFKVTHPTVSAPLFDSAFSLSNSGETIALVSQGGFIDSVTYTKGSAPGDSLQRKPGENTFAAGSPTPGQSIPSSGLVATAPKATKKSLKLAAAEVPTIADTPKAGVSSVATLLPAPQSPSLLWWLVPCAISMSTSAGVALSLWYKKDEWEIIEEMG